MARPNRQKERRADLVNAARAAIVERGIAGLKLREIAERAGMNASSVFYYYPGIDDLLADVLHDAVERFCVDRNALVAHIADPAKRLAAMIRIGLPSKRTDELCYLLYDLGSIARRDPAQAARYVTLFERQVSIYVGILEAGSGQGVFKLSGDATSIARNLVVMEDGYGLHTTMAIATFDIATAEQLIRQYASLATGCDITSIDLDK